MKIFIIHYKKLFERKIHILEQLLKHRLFDYEFVEIDRDELSNYNTIIFEENFSKHQMAICLSHFYIYKKISENYESALVLEDDVILCDNFKYVLEKYLEQLPITCDILFIGNGCNLHIEHNNLIPFKNIYKKSLEPTNWGGNGASRCADSYIINKKYSTKLYEYINNLNYKINTPIDIWLNKAFIDNNIEVYWCEPTIVTQGSQNGIFKTSY